MRFAELEGADVAIWGYGREARSVLAALRRRYPDQPLTLYCSADEAAALRHAGEPSPSGGGQGGGGLGALNIRVEPPDAEALAAHAIVVKSPGISAYKPEILAARARGTRFTSETALWFGENVSGKASDARVVAVTGTKGKSTTTALIAHLARALGVRTALAGNIGLPLLDLDGQRADLWAVELSSFQTGDAGAVELGVVVSLAEDHLDWHGTRERYIADKLKLADVSRTLLVDGGNDVLVQHTRRHPNRVLFDDPRGWHVAEGAICRRDERVFEVAALPLHGAHNAHNACAALAAIELLGMDARTAAPSLARFKPLPHRLTSLGVRDGVEWIDDSISTTPEAALAALESLRGRAVVLILGGHDRGLDWTRFATAIRARPPHAIVLQGASAARVQEALRASKCPVSRVETLADAVPLARELAARGGAVVLSPGAPSFDQFRNYADRGGAFATLAGFDPAALGEITGLGIA